MSKVAVKVVVFALCFVLAFSRPLRRGEAFEVTDAFDGPLHKFNAFNPMDNQIHRWCHHCGISDCEASKERCLRLPIGNSCQFQIIVFAPDYKEGCCTCHS
ncbi:hypothetical protein BSKO_13462 [Bryopsis sp. KO-2023]|nr:hypothetical protein BSKO_13462 [Bryopsis sp. KO-2023]